MAFDGIVSFPMKTPFDRIQGDTYFCLGMGTWDLVLLFMRILTRALLQSRRKPFHTTPEGYTQGDRSYK